MGLYADSLVLAPNTRANQPAVGDVPIGALYCVTDEDNLLERNNGVAWEQFAPTGGAGGAGDFQVMDKHSIAVMAGIESGGTYGLNLTGIGSVSTAGGSNARLLTSTNSWFDLVTAAAGTSQARTHSAFTLFQRRHDIDWQLICIAPTTLTSIRVWAGLTSATFPDSDTHTGHCAAFRFSSVAGDTGWRPVTRDGASQNVGSNIGTVTSATAYHLRIRCVLAGTPTVYFSVDGGTEQAVTANLPTSSQDLGFGVMVIAQAASARNLSFGRMLINWGTAV